MVTWAAFKNKTLRLADNINFHLYLNARVTNIIYIIMFSKT